MNNIYKLIIFYGNNNQLDDKVVEIFLFFFVKENKKYLEKIQWIVSRNYENCVQRKYIYFNKINLFKDSVIFF